MRRAKMQPLAAALLFACALFASVAAARAEDHVTLRLKWLNQAQFAGYYVAKAKGYLKAAGLDVSIQPGGSDFPAIQMIAGAASIRGDRGGSDFDRAREQVPVVALA